MFKLIARLFGRNTETRSYAKAQADYYGSTGTGETNWAQHIASF